MEDKMKASQVVIALADMASQGKYEMTRAGAQRMENLYRMVADLINELEAAEAKAEENEDG